MPNDLQELIQRQTLMLFCPGNTPMMSRRKLLWHCELTASALFTGSRYYCDALEILLKQRDVPLVAAPIATDVRSFSQRSVASRSDHYGGHFRRRFL